MAVDLATGNLLPFVADTNGPVRAIASDGASLYIGGDFTTVNGADSQPHRQARPHHRRGRSDLQRLHGQHRPRHDRDRRQAVPGRRVQPRSTASLAPRAAAVNTTNGGIDPTFNPTVASGPALRRRRQRGPDEAVPRRGDALPASTACWSRSTRRPAPRQGPTFAQVNDKVEDLNVSPDGRHVYAGTQFNSAVDWNPTTGRRTIAPAGRRRRSGRAVQQRLPLHGLPRRLHGGATSHAAPAGARPAERLRGRTRRSCPPRTATRASSRSTPTATTWWPAATSRPWAGSACAASRSSRGRDGDAAVDDLRWSGAGHGRRGGLRAADQAHPGRSRGARRPRPPRPRPPPSSRHRPPSLTPSTSTRWRRSTGGAS